MSVADILEQMAQNAGRAQLQKGAIYGHLVSQAGAIPGQIYDDQRRQALVDDEARRRNAQDARAAAQDTRQAASDAQNVADRQAAAQEKQDRSAIMGAGLDTTGPTPRFNYAPAVAEAQRRGRMDLATELTNAANKKTEFDPTKGETNAAGEIVRQPVAKPPEIGTPAYEIYNRQQQLEHAAPLAPGDYGPATPGLPPAEAAAQAYDDQRAATAKETHSPAYKEWQDAVANGSTLDFNAYQTADANRKKPTVNIGGLTGLYNATDPQAIADQIRAGKMPPDIGQYGRPVQGAIASVLAKKGPNGEPPMDLASAQREWKAQVNLNRTMNGSQQVRLDESIRSGLAMYDKVDAIAKQWDGMGLGPLSRANLAAARDGLKGKAAQSIANQLTGQIGQLTSDIATIEQGGLTPTNESRAVAEKSMNDWWGKGTILDMSAQGRYNMQIRHLARNTQEPLAPGNGVDTRPASPATPASAAPAPVVLAPPPAGRIRITNGQQSGTILATDAIPAGWSKQ